MRNHTDFIATMNLQTTKPVYIKKKTDDSKAVKTLVHLRHYEDTFGLISYNTEIGRGAHHTAFDSPIWYVIMWTWVFARHMDIVAWNL